MVWNLQIINPLDTDPARFGDKIFSIRPVLSGYYKMAGRILNGFKTINRQIPLTFYHIIKADVTNNKNTKITKCPHHEKSMVIMKITGKF